MKTIAVLGAGRVGTAIARAAHAAGLDVRIAGSGPGKHLQLLVGVVAPGVEARTAREAVDGADLTVAAIPLHKYRALDAHLLAGRVVIDAMNYWSPTDGVLPDFEDPAVTSSEVVAAHLTGAKVVKTLNHIGYHEIEVDGTLPGTPDRRGLVIAGDHSDASAAVAGFLDRLGYDPVDSGPLAQGRLFQPGTEIFGTRRTAPEIRAALLTATSRP